MGVARAGSDTAEVEAVLDQLAVPEDDLLIESAGGSFRVRNLDKVFWPPHEHRPAVTKRDLLRYLARVSPWLLPHLKDRPLTLRFLPDGIDGITWGFRHSYDRETPPFVETLSVFAESYGRNVTSLLCNNLASLLWLGHMGNLAFHMALTRVDPEPDGRQLGRVFTDSAEQVEASLLNYPDFLLFDLDPTASGDTKGALQDAAAVAFETQGLLESIGLASFVKTTGGSGLHVVAPIARNLSYAEARSVSGMIAGLVAKALPGMVTTQVQVAKRDARVYFDTAQNARGKSIIAPYSPRAEPGANVSLPLSWSELPAADPGAASMASVAERLPREGDAWAAVLEVKPDVRQLAQRTSAR